MVAEKYFIYGHSSHSRFSLYFLQQYLSAHKNKVMPAFKSNKKHHKGILPLILLLLQIYLRILIEMRFGIHLGAVPRDSHWLNQERF